ncbi:MAG: dephospho-CoA kinase [Synergistaceae bacterium]|nr:dephospho-CoA kinase [Synergistaceae bacterium]
MAVRAITGDIGSGKSAAAGILSAKLGCMCLDADAVAKSMWQRQDVKARAVSRWGSRILDASGNVIMPVLAELIFSGRSEHDFCSALIHPPVMSELYRLSRSLDNAVLEIPLLPEAGRPEWIDEAIYITADFRVRAERRRLQRGWTSGELRRREGFLLPQSERMSVCEHVIYNDGSISELQRQLEEMT